VLSNPQLLCSWCIRELYHNKRDKSVRIERDSEDKVGIGLDKLCS
jgi:hypothetical protein